MKNIVDSMQMHAESSERVMEADTVNIGASPKSQKSKGNFLKMLCAAFLAAGIVFSGCETENNEVKVSVEWDALADTTILVGRTVIVKGKITPADILKKEDFTLTSSEPDVATVEADVQGANVTITVNGISSGKSTITVTVPDRNISKSVDVTVKKEEKGDDVYLLTGLEGDEGVAKIEYDDQNRIKKVTWYLDEGEVGAIDAFSYSDGDLTSVKHEYPNYSEDNNISTYTKIGNKIIFSNGAWIELNAQELPEKYVSETIYEDGEKHTYLWILQYQDGNKSKMEVIWECFDKDGNKIEDRSSYSSTTYTYDDKKSPFYHCKTPKWWFIYEWADIFGVQNNVKTETWTRDGEIETSTTEYTYNAAGFPLTQKTIYDDGEEYTMAFKYDKKSAPQQSFAQNSYQQETPRRTNAGKAPIKKNAMRQFPKHRFGGSHFPR